MMMMMMASASESKKKKSNKQKTSGGGGGGASRTSATAPHRRPVPNKPKPPVVIAAHECPSALRAHVLEVPPGRDVLSCVSAFARRGRRGALVLGAAGHVADVVLRDPAALVLRGTMEILSLAGCFFPFSASAAAAVFLAGPRGTVLGGAVAPGGLVAAGPVVVVVATFVAAALDRLPLLLINKAAGGGAPPPRLAPAGGRVRERTQSSSGQRLADESSGIQSS